MDIIKKLKIFLESLSTRITVAVSLLWLAFIALGGSDLIDFYGIYGEDILVTLLIGLAVIWLIKLLLGSIVDNQKE